MTQMGFHFDASACIGCKACAIACKDRSNVPVGQKWRRVYELTNGTYEKQGETLYPNISAFYLSIACNHCENPACVQVCPTNAMHKREDGVVLIDQDACIGCRYCEWACPYSAPQFDDSRGVMAKCDFCYDRLDAGEAPVCVAACPQRALNFGDVEELRAKYGTVNEVAPMPPAGITQPSLVITPHRNAGMTGAFAITNAEEV